jgi:hypothetical protein
MLLADTSTGAQFVLLALLGLTTAVLLSRGHRRRTRAAGLDIAAEARAGCSQGRAGTAEIQRLESRLYDFDREVEGRVATTLAMLDRLIEEAESEIARLEDAVERSRRMPVVAARVPDVVIQRPLSSRERRMIAHLSAAGYTAGEIAQLTGRPAGDVSATLGGTREAA